MGQADTRNVKVTKPVRGVFPSSFESRVRYYCRTFPVVFERAVGAEMFDTDGNRYIDFLAGSGALNYGHNHPRFKEAIVRYLAHDGVLHSLDLHTEAKAEFIRRFVDVILKPRGMDYRLQFTGPTGTNAVEAALKLARKVTGRSRVVAFTGAFHGVSMGSLALTASPEHRSAAGLPLNGTIRMPYDGFLGLNDELTYIERMLTAPGGGEEPPAAFVVETVQGEGLACASAEWLSGIQRLARSMGSLLIVDDIFAGCGRTGTFFSFERHGIEPEIICLSKSIGGIGLPLALVLIKPDCDCWNPGEHNGTFRGNNLALVAAAEALAFWEEPQFLSGVQDVIRVLDSELTGIENEFYEFGVRAVGRGSLRGIEVEQPEVAASVQAAAFRRGLMFERCGARNSVVKLLPPLNIPAALLREAMDILAESLRASLEPAPAGKVYETVQS
jgi:diaminobutyrate-2-oxoglutarate transaminase